MAIGATAMYIEKNVKYAQLFFFCLKSLKCSFHIQHGGNSHLQSFFSALPAITGKIRLLMAVPNHVGVCASSVTVSTFGDTQMKHFKHRQKAAGGQAGKLKRQTVPLLMELMRT